MVRSASRLEISVRNRLSLSHPVVVLARNPRRNRNENFFRAHRKGGTIDSMSFNSDESWANRAAKAVLLIRIHVGWVFLSEGIQKFLFPDSLGVGRFVKIGVPWPQVMAPFISVVEIVCGALLLIGLMTRLASIPLLIYIFVALYATKIVTLAKNELGAHCTKPAPT